MSQYNPFPFSDSLESDLPDGAQPIFYDEQGNPTYFEPIEQFSTQIPIESSQETSDYSSCPSSPMPHVQTATDDPSFVKTDLQNLRTVVATRIGYNGGRLSEYLKVSRGLLILPLRYISFLRKPSSHHTSNPTCVIYQPLSVRQQKEDESNYPIIAEIMRDIA